MTERKHTPKPWRAIKGAVIADHDTGWDDEDNMGGYGGHMVCESVRWKANGNLIAAAPEMLEALRALVLNERLINDPHFQGAQEKLMAIARDAIAKAEGRTT